MKREDFHRWFNRQFWRGFKNRNLPISIPQTQKDKQDLIETIYLSVSSARYAPSIPEAEIVINKGHGVARTVPVFAIQDYCVYYFCIKNLEDILCGNRTQNTFGGWTLGGKFRRQEESEIECELTDYGRYSFNPQAWMQVFGEFNSLLFSQLDQENYTHVLQLDLSNFYDSVRLDILERWIREEADSSKGWIITLLFYLLNHWNRRNTGLHPQAVGLPQDALADCSRILANYYLQRYDKFAANICGKIGAMYFRYADDQMILLNDPSKVELLLLLLTRNLDRFGLRVNQKKVVLWESPKLQQHRCRSIQAIFANKGDNQNPILVRQFVKHYLAIPEMDLANTWNSGMPLLNRLLWSNLESLPGGLFEKLLLRFTSDQYLRLADHRKLERINYLNSKRSTAIDFPKRLRDLGEQSVHNAYHHEVLAFAISMKDADLTTVINSRLTFLQQQMNVLESQ